jgi:hypothetical protein
MDEVSKTITHSELDLVMSMTRLRQQYLTYLKNITRLAVLSESTWWGWQFGNITFTEDLDVNIKELRQLLDEDNSTAAEETPEC